MAVPASPRSATPTIPSCLVASELPSTLLPSEPPPAPRWDAACRSRSAWPGHLDPSAVVAKEYQITLIETQDGRVLIGVIKQDLTETFPPEKRAWNDLRSQG